MEEYILCAAIWFNDNKNHEHQPKNVSNGFIVCGRRHHNCFITVTTCAFIFTGKGDVTLKINKLYKQTIQGFLTNLNRFVNRKEAGKIAFKSGQIKKETDCLMSEDLY